MDIPNRWSRCPDGCPWRVRRNLIAWLLVVAIVALLLFWPGWARLARAAELRWDQVRVAALFRPGDAVTAAVVEALDEARREVLVQAYSFTSAPIADALIQAHRRGLVVTVVVDKGQRTAKGGQAGRVAEAGVWVVVDRRHAIAHNKIMIIDGQRVLTGSFNWTASAEDKNAENLVILDSPALAARYADNWRKHFSHSEEW